MKVIDLLVSIWNGEEAPKRIRYNNRIYNFDEKEQDYIKEDSIFGLLDEINTFDGLDEEVYPLYYESQEYKIEKINIPEMLQKKKWKRDKNTWQKINEIIDKINNDQL